MSENKNTEDARVKEAFFIVEPNQAELAEAGRLLDAGAYCGKVRVDAGAAKWWWQFLWSGGLTFQ